MSDHTTDELRDLVARLGLSQRATARMLGVPSRNFRHMCAGTHEIPNAIVLAIRQLILDAQPPTSRSATTSSRSATKVD